MRRSSASLRSASSPAYPMRRSSASLRSASSPAYPMRRSSASLRSASSPAYPMRRSSASLRSASSPAYPMRRSSASLRSASSPARPSRSRTCDFHHLEVGFRGTEARAAPIFGTFVPAGAGRDAVFRPNQRLVVLEAALDAAEQFVVTHFVTSIVSKSSFRVLRIPGSGKRPSRSGPVAGQDLLPPARLHVDPTDVAAVMRQHPVVHQLAPQRRGVSQPDQRRLAARQIRCPVHAAQRLVAPGRVGVVIAVPLQVVQEQVGHDVVGVPAVLGRAALVAAVGVLLPQESSA